VSEAERRARCDLSLCHRLIHMHGMTDMFFTHASLRIDGEDYFLVTPFGVLFSHVTPESLVKVHIDGSAVNVDETFCNSTAFHIHSALQRRGHRAVLHTHTAAGNAIAASSDGLLPVTQKAMLVLPFIRRHPYNALATGCEEGESIADALSEPLQEHEPCRVLVLDNHGLLTVGDTMGEAFLWMEWMEKACNMQTAMSLDRVLVPSDTALEKTYAQARQYLGRNGALRFNSDRYWQALIKTVH